MRLTLGASWVPSPYSSTAKWEEKKEAITSSEVDYERIPRLRNSS